MSAVRQLDEEEGWPLEGDIPLRTGHEDLTDLPKRIRQKLEHVRLKRHVAPPRCLRCGRHADLNPAVGICAGCSPTIAPWRLWLPSDGPPPFYDPDHSLSACLPPGPRRIY